MKKIFLVFLFFNICAMEEEQTFKLEDDSIVKTNPFPIIEKLRKLNEKELCELWLACTPQLKFDSNIIVSNPSEGYKDLFIKLSDIKLAQKYDDNSYFISSDIRKIIFNTITIKDRCCKKYVVLVNPMKKYHPDYDSIYYYYNNNDCAIL